MLRSSYVLLPAYCGRKTLVVFDEIQEAPRGITSLKYFCEDAPEQHVVVAGSLLGVIHHPGESYPVGKVDMMRLYPMTFEEFLWACGKEKLAEIVMNCEWNSLIALHSTLEDLLRQYYYVGGMPEAVLSWTTREIPSEIRRFTGEHPCFVCQRHFEAYGNGVRTYSHGLE